MSFYTSNNVFIPGGNPGSILFVDPASPNPGAVTTDTFFRFDPTNDRLIIWGNIGAGIDIGTGNMRVSLTGNAGIGIGTQAGTSYFNIGTGPGPVADIRGVFSNLGIGGTSSNSLIDVSGEWNTTGTPTGIRLNVTDTASNAASLLMDLQVGGVSRFSVRKGGEFVLPGGTANGVLYLNGSKVVTSGSALTFNGTTLTATNVQLASSGSIVDGGGNATLTPTSGGSVALTSNGAYTNGNIVYNALAATGVHVFSVNSAEQMRLTSTGLGIGTSSPAGKLDTRGTAYLGSDSNNSLVVDSTSSLVTIAAAGRTAFSTSALRFLTSNGTAALERARIDSAGNVVVGTAALATSATDGFLYVPTCAGTPTGTPTTQTGTAPIVVNTTNNKLYFYSGGQWRDAGP